MAAAKKFMFDTDFRGNGRKAVDEAALEAARAEGFHSGLDQARHESEQRLGSLLAQLVRHGERLLAQQDERLAEIEAQAAQLAIATARSLAGAALADKPLVQLLAAARECLAHARHAPHLAIRVHESLVETVEGKLSGLARETGFAGRIVVLGEPDIAIGDGRLEWADGGIAIERAELDEAVDRAVKAVFGPEAG
ncbi:FliH/SctL family protein [Bosea vestrisii]|uniref:FliH/SctL family protein n=1 Tax=Bosea vestrisii TaxID=151416 RepID=UPI0024DFF8E0|nr:FliH/SctL family protein [Bosea vestrisii]WID98714.1 FliH/SctL family protein [Bosea vestrisii]